MNDQAIKTLAENWQLVAALGAAVMAAGALIGAVLVSAFRFVDRWEKRIESIVMRVVDSTLASPAFGQAVRQISEAFTAEVKAQISELRQRDNERAAAVGRAHQRIDELESRTNDHLLDLAKRIGGGS